MGDSMGCHQIETWLSRYCTPYVTLLPGMCRSHGGLDVVWWWLHGMSTWLSGTSLIGLKLLTTFMICRCVHKDESDYFTGIGTGTFPGIINAGCVALVGLVAPSCIDQRGLGRVEIAALFKDSIQSNDHNVYACCVTRGVSGNRCCLAGVQLRQSGGVQYCAGVQKQGYSIVQPARFDVVQVRHDRPRTGSIENSAGRAIPRYICMA